jgi:site-specific recombinase XerD
VIFIKKQFIAGDFTLSPNQAKVIIHSTTNFRDRCLLKCLYYAGMRREETTLLEIADIDFFNRRIRITGKFNKIRIIPFSDFEFMGDMKHLIGTKTSGKVFDVSIRQVNWIVQKAGEKANIPNPNPNLKHINPHLFRHSIARHLKAQGFSLETLQNFLGHEKFTTTMDVYGRQGIDEMQSEFDKKLGLIPNNEVKLIQ